MFNPYANNAYRLLGLAAGQELPLNPDGQLDTTALKPPLRLPDTPLAPRNDNVIRDAVSRLGDTRIRNRQAATWLVRQDEIDEEAWKLLESGHYHEALRLWTIEAEKGSFNAVHNAAVLSHVMALGSDVHSREFWDLWRDALVWWVRVTAARPDELVRSETKETIVEDLRDLAEASLEEGQPRRVGSVLRIFERASMPAARLNDLERRFVGDEADRLRYACARIREQLVTIMRQRPEQADHRIAACADQFAAEIEPNFEWISQAALPEGRLVLEISQEVALLYRTLANTWGSIANDLERQQEALRRAYELAPPELQEEIGLELQTLSRDEGLPELAPPLKQPPPLQPKRPPAPPTAAGQNEGLPCKPPRESAIAGTGTMLIGSGWEAFGEDGRVGNVTRYFTLLWLPLIPLSRYRMWYNSQGLVLKATSLPMSEALLLHRVIGLVGVALALMLAAGLLFRMEPAVDIELEEASLKAKIEVVEKRLGTIAEEAGQADEEVQKLREQLTKLEGQAASEPAAAQKLEQTRKALEQAQEKFSELDAARDREWRRLKLLRDTLYRLAP